MTEEYNLDQVATAVLYNDLRLKRIEEKLVPLMGWALSHIDWTKAAIELQEHNEEEIWDLLSSTLLEINSLKSKKVDKQYTIK